MKRAVVLSGGGSRGAYQVGVWRALIELNLDFHIVTGSSIGALNGALMVQNDYQYALDIWENLHPHAVVAEDIIIPTQMDSVKDLFKTFLHEAIKNNGADITPLENMVRQYLDETKLKQSPIDFAIVTVQYPAFKPVQLHKHQIPEGKLVDYLLASAACHPAFKMREIMGQKYLDGGYYDNLPINLALDLGADEVIAVDLHAFGLKQAVKTSKPITYIESYWNLGPTLLFDSQIAKRNMLLGYYDTLKAFDQKSGHAYTFDIINQNEIMALYNKMTLTLYGYFYNITDNKQSGRFEKRFRYALQQLLKHRECPTLDTLQPQEFTVLAAEVCGEFLRLPPTCCYTLSDFNQQLLEHLRQLLTGGIAPPNNLIIDAERVKQSQQGIVVFYIDILQTMQQVDKPHSLPLSLNDNLEQLLAATYLAVLMM